MNKYFSLNDRTSVWGFFLTAGYTGRIGLGYWNCKTSNQQIRVSCVIFIAQGGLGMIQFMWCFTVYTKYVLLKKMKYIGKEYIKDYDERNHSA